MSDRASIQKVNIQEAKTHLSRLVADVESGGEVVLARAGKPVARIVPLEVRPLRRPGRLKGLGWIGADFDDPLDPEVQAAFEGRGA
ncbi:MAG: prevent-host-death family protein [Thermoleophilia bacterium]|nr:prevent-host-death family protein [Thermoleophilia bacterium]